MKSNKDYEKMADRAGAAEVRENIAMARASQLEHAVKLTLKEIEAGDYDGAIAVLKTALYAKKKEAD